MSAATAPKLEPVPQLEEVPHREMTRDERIRALSSELKALGTEAVNELEHHLTEVIRLSRLISTEKAMHSPGLVEACRTLCGRAETELQQVKVLRAKSS